MIITYEESSKKFVAQSTYEERMLLKQAGFLWDPGARCWWTKIPRNAAAVRKACDPVALAVIDGHFTRLEASRATDAKIEIPAPQGLEYLPYQKAGIALIVERKAVLNADEPGLGKTIQALGAINALPAGETRRILVVCPNSLRLNWSREAAKWLCGTYFIDIVNGGFSDREGPLMVIINYEKLVVRMPAIAGTQWDIVIVDEAHYIKNPKAKRSAIVYDIAAKAPRKMFLTGTPILNRPAELQSIIGILDPMRWGDPRDARSKQRWKYLYRYCGAHQEPIGYGHTAWVFDGASHLDELQERLRASIMIRRLKSDVLTELPAKRRSLVPVDIFWREPEWARKHLENLEAAEAELQLARIENDRTAYAAAAKKLKAVSDVAFENISRYRHELAVAKLPATIEYVQTMLDGNGKVVLFAHHRDVIQALHKEFEKDGAVIVYGEMKAEDRQAAVDRFQTDASCRVFVGGIMAAGVGLTLTAACHVVFAEMDWVPANITQAEDRCHRIGQKDVVFVHQLIVEDTLDANMIKKVVWKQNVADQALDIVPSFEELNVEFGVPEPGSEVEREKIPTEQKNRLLEALRFLAMHCDGAREEDGTGFNRLDTSFGKSLATREKLTDKQYEAGWKMARKYRGQLPGELAGKLEFFQ